MWRQKRRPRKTPALWQKRPACHKITFFSQFLHMFSNVNICTWNLVVSLYWVDVRLLGCKGPGSQEHPPFSLWSRFDTSVAEKLLLQLSASSLVLEIRWNQAAVSTRKLANPTVWGEASKSAPVWWRLTSYHRASGSKEQLVRWGDLWLCSFRPSACYIMLHLPSFALHSSNLGRATIGASSLVRFMLSQSLPSRSELGKSFLKKTLFNYVELYVVSEESLEAPRQLARSLVGFRIRPMEYKNKYTKDIGNQWIQVIPRSKNAAIDQPHCFNKSKSFVRSILLPCSTEVGGFRTLVDFPFLDLLKSSTIEPF